MRACVTSVSAVGGAQLEKRVDAELLKPCSHFLHLPPPPNRAKRATGSSRSMTVIPWVYLSLVRLHCTLSPPPQLPSLPPAVVRLSFDSLRPQRSRRSVVTGAVKSHPTLSVSVPPAPRGPSAHWVPLMMPVVSCDFQARHRGNSLPVVMRQLPFLFPSTRIES